jgi:acyl-CoA synthetase (AMP-forming)/AMP-acid ligase II
MQVLLQAYVAGARLIAPNTSDFSSAINALVSKGCKSLSATPTLWRKILMASESDGLSLDQVTLGGEIVDQNILNILSKRFANAKITHIYASTEAGVGFSVQDGKSGFPSKWLEIGVRNIKLMLSSDSTLLIKNTTHGQFYINDLITASLCDDDGWIDTGDIVEVTADRAYFKGRLNGSINIGGNKVFPEEVETEILKVAGVSQVVVRGKSSSIAGQLLEALIVPSDNVTDFKALIGAIKDTCASNLPKFKRPVFFKQVNQIEISASGKLKR